MQEGNGIQGGDNQEQGNEGVVRLDPVEFASKYFGWIARKNQAKILKVTDPKVIVSSERRAGKDVIALIKALTHGFYGEKVIILGQNEVMVECMYRELVSIVFKGTSDFWESRFNPVRNGISTFKNGGEIEIATHFIPGKAYDLCIYNEPVRDVLVWTSHWSDVQRDFSYFVLKEDITHYLPVDDLDLDEGVIL